MIAPEANRFVPRTKTKGEAFRIADAVRNFRCRPRPVTAWRILELIVRHGRTAEVLYSIWCFLRFRPSISSDSEINGAGQELARHLMRRVFSCEVSGAEAKRELSLAHVMPDEIKVRGPSVLVTDDWSVVGEYGDGKRLFFRRGCGPVRVVDFYVLDRRVRHIHLIHRLDEDHFAVCTGDAGKYLDIWRVDGHEIRFVRRAVKSMAGYTAAARVNGDHYFGSDFSGRPNYIVRLSDGKKFPFPTGSYRHFAVNFVGFQDRYILCAATDLVAFGGAASFFLFDAQEERFHALSPR